MSASVPQGLVVEHTVAEALKVRVGNLILELLTHTFCCLCPFSSAGAISAGSLEPLADGVHYFLVGIELNFHFCHLFRRLLSVL